MTRIIAPIPLHDPYDYSASGPIEISMAVETLALLNAIPERKRWIGKTVYVISEEADYRLLKGITNDHWTKVETNAAASEFWECAGVFWIYPQKKTWGFNPFNADSPNYLPVTWAEVLQNKTYEATIDEDYLNTNPNKTACMASFSNVIISSEPYHLLLRQLNLSKIQLLVARAIATGPAVSNSTHVNIHIRIAKPSFHAPAPPEYQLQPDTYVATIDDTGTILSLPFNVPLDQHLPDDLVDAFTLTGKTFTAAQLTQTGSIKPDTLLLTLNEAADETYSGDLAYDHTVAELKSWWGQVSEDFVCSVKNEIPPTFVSAETNTDGDEVVITMSRNMDKAADDLEDSFTITAGIRPITVTSVDIHDAEITLTLGLVIGYEETVTVAFDGVVDLLSLDGTDTEAFTAQSVTNNTVEP